VHPTRIHLKNEEIKLNLVGMPYNFKKLLKNESFSGHLNYSAPEILESGQENKLTPKVDIWSLGCCLYYLTTKRDPFDGQNPHEIKSNIRALKIDRYPQDTGKDDKGNDRHFIIQKILQYCLTIDYNQRPSATRLIELIDQLIIGNKDIFKADIEIQRVKSKNDNH
jgi:serine/threonine protein kinase